VTLGLPAVVDIRVTHLIISTEVTRDFSIWVPGCSVVEKIRVYVNTAYRVPQLRDMRMVKGGAKPLLCMPLRKG
jgi:hypothetical protein